MRRTLTTLAILASFAAPALADDNRLVKAVYLADLQSILTEEGYVIEESTSEGEISVQALDSEGTGLIFHLTGTACETDITDGCLGINMEVRYDADGTESLARVNEANIMWSATSTWYAAPEADGEVGTLAITRYVILDGGQTIGNIKVNLENLLAIAPQVADYVWETGEYAPE